MSDSAFQKSYKVGETIMRQGDPGETAYIVESGRVEIRITGPDGQERIVGTRGPGTMVGEMSLIDSAPRTASVVALEECRLLEINRDDFSRRLGKADPVIKLTAQVIMARYRDVLARAVISGESRGWPPVETQELGYAGETKAVESVKLASELKGALKSRELFLAYQPLIDVSSGKVAGFEALMRWNHPVRGFISPAVFIPVAEQTGLIVEASRWALREACQALKRIESTSGYNSGLFMSVNFSSADFASEDFVNTIYNIVSETDVPMSAIHLEITERLLMDQPDNARETLGMCRQAGMSIAIDDFGTGFSSLSYLHHFPIDTLKIDQTFIRQMQKDEGSMQLVRSILLLAKNMKMKVIAEGVEHKEEAQILKALGCDMIQGYYFARPMPEKDAAAFVGERKVFEV